MSCTDCVCFVFSPVDFLTENSNYSVISVFLMYMLYFILLFTSDYTSYTTVFCGLPGFCYMQQGSRNINFSWQSGSVEMRMLDLLTSACQRSFMKMSQCYKLLNCSNWSDISLLACINTWPQYGKLQVSVHELFHSVCDLASLTPGCENVEAGPLRLHCEVLTQLSVAVLAKKAAIKTVIHAAEKNTPWL